MVNNGLMVKDEPHKVDQEIKDGSSDNDESKEEAQPPSYRIADGVPSTLSIQRSALESLVRWYCREAGGESLQTLQILLVDAPPHPTIFT